MKNSDCSNSDSPLLTRFYRIYTDSLLKTKVQLNLSESNKSVKNTSSTYFERCHTAIDEINTSASLQRNVKNFCA